MAQETGWSIVWDTDLRGFGLRVLPSGTKTFVVFYRSEAGEKRLVSIGRFGELAADEARREMGERGRYVANRTLALVSHLFSWAEREGLLPEGHPNPARGVRRFREESRDRWLKPGEVRSLRDTAGVVRACQPSVTAL